jgi:PTS system galactitol-specific IIC component
MATFFKSLQDILSAMGPTVMLPIIIFVLGLILGIKPGRALRSGVTIGIAFVGINLVIGLMWGALAGISEAIVTKTGVQLTAVDVGWPTAAAIAFGSSVGTFIIPLALLVNILLLLPGLTRTLNIDVWNFWHFAFVGSLTVVLTGNLVLGLAAAAVASMLALFISDWTAKGIQSFYSLPGISITTASAQAFVIPAIPVNKLLDKIPGLRDWKADPDTIQKKWGVFGEPIILGLVLGLILGAIAYLPPSGEGVTWSSELVKVLSSGVNLAAVMLLLPRMVQILMEGLIPISEGARDFMAKRFAGREFYIGLDAAILIGHPSSIAASLILVPIVILLAIILPGNRMMPFADLAAIPFFVCMFAPITRGNVVRMIILGTLGAIAGLYLASWMAPLQTAAAPAAGVAIPAGATMITNMGDGWVLSVGALIAPATVSAAAEWIWLVVAAVLIFALFRLFNRDEERWSEWAGTPSEAEPAALD